MRYTDFDTGYSCEVCKNRLGTYCGYVGVPSDHPLFREDYDDIEDIEVHGGLTFSGDRINSNLWWLGFDCAHYGDFIPGNRYSSGVFRDIDYVQSEIKELARQLHERRES